MFNFSNHFEQKAFALITKTEKLASRSQRQFIYRVGILTIYGFQVAIPIVLAIFLGIFLDKTFPNSRVSWILNCILVGALIGFYNANRWFYKMIGVRPYQKTNISSKHEEGGHK